MVNLLILVFAVFLGWVLYLTYLLYSGTKSLRYKSSVVLAAAIKNSGSLTKTLKITNKTIKSIILYKQLKKAFEAVKNVSILAGLIFKKIKL